MAVHDRIVGLRHWLFGTPPPIDEKMEEANANLVREVRGLREDLEAIQRTSAFEELAKVMREGDSGA